MKLNQKNDSISRKTKLIKSRNRILTYFKVTTKYNIKK